MRHYIEEIKDFPKKGDTFLLVLCLIISGFGLVCIASATTAEKFDGNFRYIALQSFAVLMGVAAFIMISSLDLDMLSEHRAWLVAFNCVLLLMLIPFGTDNGSGNRSWLNIPGLPFNIQPAEICKITYVVIMASVMSSHQNTISHPFSVIHMGFHLAKIPNNDLSSDCRLQLACMKLELLVIADQHAAVNTFPGLYTPPVTP